MIGTWRTLARTNGAQCFERDGVVALVNPAVPERSVFNSVGYTDADASSPATTSSRGLRRARLCLDRLGSRGRRRGGAAAREPPATSSTPRRGRWAMSLAEVEEPDLGDIEWTADGDIQHACLINDPPTATPRGPGRSSTGRGRRRAPHLHRRGRRAPAATVATIDAGERLRDLERRHRAGGPRPRPFDRAHAAGDLGRSQRGLRDLQPAGHQLGRPVYERVGLRGLRRPADVGVAAARAGGRRTRMPGRAVTAPARAGTSSPAGRCARCARAGRSRRIAARGADTPRQAKSSTPRSSGSPTPAASARPRDRRPRGAEAAEGARLGARGGRLVRRVPRGRDAEGGDHARPRRADQPPFAPCSPRRRGWG